MSSLGLGEALIEKYGKKPNMHSCSSCPIDGFFISEGVNILQGGYTSFGDLPSDHRWLWLDMSTQELLGTSMDTRACPIERKATWKTLSVRDLFNSELNAHLDNYHMHEKVLTFYDLCKCQIKQHGELSLEQKRTMNILNDRIQSSVSFADSKCRKGRVGKILFSTEAQRIMGAMPFQKLMLMHIKLKGRAGHPRKRCLWCLAKQYKYTRNVAISDHAEVKALIQLTSKEYAAFRPKASNFRSTYLGRIANELRRHLPGGSFQEYYATREHQKQI